MIKKNFLISLFLFFFLFSFITSCATAPKPDLAEKEKVTDEKKTDQKTKDKTPKDNDLKNEKETKKDKVEERSGDSEKKKPAKIKKKTYDGLKYVGPATENFNDGIGKYFTDGCLSALDLWKDGFDKDEGNSVIAYNIALCYQRLNKIEESKKWYEKSFKNDMNFTPSLYNLALIYGEDLSAMEKYFTDLVEKMEDGVQKNNFLAWFYLKTGKNDLSEKHSKAVLKEDEQNSEAVITLASVYFSKKMYELAESALITAEKWDSENFRLHRLYGFLAYEKGDKNKANIHLQKAIKINPEMPEVRNTLSVLAMEIEDFQTAKEHLDFALKIRPDFKSAKMNLALALKGLEEFKKARDILEELEKDKEISHDMRKAVIYNLGILYLDSDVEGNKDPQRFDKAVDYFNKYIAFIKKEKDVYKEKKPLLDRYIKEAFSEKRKMEMLLKRQIAAEKKKKEREEEHKLFLENKSKAFENAMKEDKFEVWEKYLSDFPVLNEDDKLSLAAKARYEELKSQKTKNEETNENQQENEVSKEGGNSKPVNEAGDDESK